MNYPAPVTFEDLTLVLADALTHVEGRDSFEGFIEWVMPTAEVVPDGTFALLRARYRVGNSEGQGGLRTFGRMHPPPMVRDRDSEAMVPDLTAPDVPPAE